MVDAYELCHTNFTPSCQISKEHASKKHERATALKKVEEYNDSSDIEVIATIIVVCTQKKLFCHFKFTSLMYRYQLLWEKKNFQTKKENVLLFMLPDHKAYIYH